MTVISVLNTKQTFAISLTDLYAVSCFEVKGILFVFTLSVIRVLKTFLIEFYLKQSQFLIYNCQRIKNIM